MRNVGFFVSVIIYDFASIDHAQALGIVITLSAYSRSQIGSVNRSNEHAFFTSFNSLVPACISCLYFLYQPEDVLQLNVTVHG